MEGGRKREGERDIYLSMKMSEIKTRTWNCLKERERREWSARARARARER